MFAGKKVVVVMPAYNAAATLRKTYDEVMAQNIVDLVVLVDDRSRDETVADQVHPGEPKLKCGRQHSESVLDAATKVDGRGFGKIQRRATHFSDRVPKPNDLREHLVVEHEII